MHEHFTALREREVALTRLETELAQAQLRALKAQLQPHFLFNTLHAITVLIRHDTDRGGRMVMQLSDLLRMTLLDSDRQEATLEAGAPIPPAVSGDRADPIPRPARGALGRSPPGLEDAAVPTLLLPAAGGERAQARRGAPGGGGRVVHRRQPERRARSPSGRRQRARTPERRAETGAGIGSPSARGRGWSALYGAEHRFTLEPNGRAA